ncbi:MAG: hypothetical protein A2932_00695 [Candidatus Spechtbacteria bacterium RIFCSPLOWO2_01_FULL_46_10]|uniref:PEGA domain-containing protein n=1 Tax=Candidatus Spechtbacteria bacterium RIFCSPLOWO2_01_FULL_46_10 TaxID=1802163 RepID=A0A1G2HI86_9BACT|nr:MAG: hypothetical protein A2932_00695 [Candidatus Spechtbacteria bacterium RIFCSPLOWO2_01_FULL_46_10]
MIKRQRTILFTSFVLIFLIATPSVVLYTRGYRINFTERTIVQTGGISITPHPSNASVLLDGEEKEKTSFLFRDAVFRNILPRTYNVRVEKEGYTSWEKFLVVREGKVEQVKNLRLFPKEPQVIALASDATVLAISPNSKYTAVVNLNREMGTNELSLLRISGNEAQKETINLSFSQIDSARFSKNSEVLLIESRLHGIARVHTLQVGELQNAVRWDAILRTVRPSVLRASAILFPSDDPQMLFALEQSKIGRLLFAITNSGKVTPTVLDEISAFALTEKNIFYINTKGTLIKALLAGKPKDELDDEFAFPRAGRENARIVVRDDEKAVLILQEGVLYLWEEEKSVRQVAKGQFIAGASFSPDREKFEYHSTTEIIIEWTRDIFGPPTRKIGDEERINAFSGVGNVVWLDANYIGIQLPDRIGFAELDSRDKRNSAFYKIQTSPQMLIVGPEKNTLLTGVEGNFAAILLE